MRPKTGNAVIVQNNRSNIAALHKHGLRVNINIRNQLCDLSLIRFGVFANLREVLAEPVVVHNLQVSDCTSPPLALWIFPLTIELVGCNIELTIE